MNLQAHPELIERLAAAYALGTLRGGARRRFEAMARQHPAVRAQALAWQERFAAMTELQQHQAPSPNVWKRIQNTIEAEAAVATAGARPAARQPVRTSPGWWRGAALAGGLATVAVAVVALQLASRVERQDTTLADASRQREQLARQNAELLAQLQSRPDIRYVAVLADDKQAPSMLVTFDPRQNTLTLKRVAGFQEAPDRSLQLWALPPGAGPRSLGVLGAGAVVRLTAAEAAVREVPALAISLEPRGGAPQGSGPTGPVLFKGALLQTGT